MIDRLEKKGQFVKAEEIRAAKRQKKPKIHEGTTIASEIIELVKSSVSNILTDKELNTSIFYIEKMAEAHLNSLQETLAASIQEVLDKKIGVNFEK